MFNFAAFIPRAVMQSIPLLLGSTGETIRTFRRYLLSAIVGSQPAMLFWLMIPTFPEPFGDSQMMIKKATSCVAT